MTKGDRVAIAMRNFPEWSVVFWAAAALGAVIVPLNAWWTSPELEYGLRDSGAKVLIADEERVERLASLLPDLGLPTVVVRNDAAPPAGVDTYTSVLGEIVGELPDVEVDPEDDATIFYTSGTTGRPKGALGTQRNITTNPLSLAYGIAFGEVRAGGALEEALAPQAARHAAERAALPRDRLPLDPHRERADRRHARADAQVERRTRPRTHRTRAASRRSAASPRWPGRSSRPRPSTGTTRPASPESRTAVPPPRRRSSRRSRNCCRTGSRASGYGLTETSSVTTYNSGVNYLEHPDSVGPPVAVCDVKVVDLAGNELPNGEVGELIIQGPNIIKGYWNRPEATAEAFVGGWFHSGDLARVDDEGFVYIVDRAKDMLIRGGENVYCAEVEAAAYEHPSVSDAAVIGVPHEELGEEVGVVICLRPGASLKVEELQTFLRERIAAFKVPAHVWFRDGELPRNPGGKILKTRLRKEILG